MKKIKILSIAILVTIISLAILKFVQSHSTSELLKVAADSVRVQPTQPPVKRPGQDFYTQREPKGYQVIAENNLFRPLGWKKEVVKKVKPAPRREIEPPPFFEPPPPPPTYTLVLTGIVQSGSEWIAVVEDTKRNDGAFLRHGERLKDALVTELLPESIRLARGDTEIQLALGESIEYGESERLLFDTARTAKRAETRPETSDGQQSLIERLRARRRKELTQ